MLSGLNKCSNTLFGYYFLLTSKPPCTAILHLLHVLKNFDLKNLNRKNSSTRDWQIAIPFRTVENPNTVWLKANLKYLSLHSVLFLIKSTFFEIVELTVKKSKFHNSQKVTPSFW